MDKHTFLGKRNIGYTRLFDFTDYQGLGSDPLYRRYPSVLSILRRVIPQEYVSFLAIPDQPAGEDIINWYIPEWTETPQRLVDLTGAEAQRYRQIKDAVIATYRAALNTLSGEELMVMGSVLRYIDDEFIYCADGHVYVLAWGMTPDKNKHIASGEIVHVSPNLIRYTVKFDAGQNGSITGGFGTTVKLPGGSTLTPDLVPTPVANEGYEFAGWNPTPDNQVVEADMVFTAQYRKTAVAPPQPPVVPPPAVLPVNISFDAGDYGTLSGNPTLTKMPGEMLTAAEIPTVTPSKGYKFTGWDIDPLASPVSGNMTVTAKYDEVRKRGIWSRWWFWLLLLLLTLLLSWLLSWLLPGCKSTIPFLSGCSSCSGGAIAVDDPNALVNIGIDDPEANLKFEPIIPVDGRLPGDGESVVAPIRDPGGKMPELIRDPGVPPTMAGRLILFLEDDNASVDQLASDFKAAYPGDQYNIIGYDRLVKSLVIQIPENERDQIRNSIAERLPNQKFLVMDERVYELNRTAKPTLDATPGWHLKAVNAYQAWNITKGSPDVTVAVVDDGFDGSHTMFSGRIVKPYNVFTQNNRLAVGSGHGTHTAGLAAGSQEYLSKGASGMAPDCKLMPIQVFDGELCPMSALVSGVMYAIHQGADVVNMSVGPDFDGLNILPVEAQDEIAKTRFRNEAYFWKRVCDIAAKKNTILVFSAGNNAILSAIPPENRNASTIVVGAINEKLQPSEFSNYGIGTHVSAPGSGILSSMKGGGLEFMDGTSMSAPIVAGTIALMKSLKKDLTVEQARNVLQRTGMPVCDEMPPRILADKALEAVKRGDFSAPAAGQQPGLGSGVADEGGVFATTPGQGVVADPGVTIGGGSDLVIVDGPGVSVTNPGTAPVAGTTPGKGKGGSDAPAVAEENDNEAILRQIRIYKEKIAELEKKLK